MAVYPLDNRLLALGDKKKWDQTAFLSVDAVAQDMGYSKLVQTIMNEETGAPGAKAHDVQPIVGAGRPTERSSAFAYPDSGRPKAIDSQSKTYKDIRRVVPLSQAEYDALMMGGQWEAFQRDLAAQTLAVIMSDIAEYIKNANSNSYAPIPSLNPAASSDDAIAASHTLLDGSSTWSNKGTVALNQTNVKAADKAFGLELDPFGSYTHTSGRFLVAEDDGLLDETIKSLVGSSAQQYNPNQKFNKVRLAGLGDPASGGTWAIYSGKRIGGLTIGFMGSTVPGRDGHIRVSMPEWSETLSSYAVNYGAAYAILSGTYMGTYFSNSGW